MNIVATIERIFYRSDKGWTIAKTNECTVKGVIPGDPKPGDRYEFRDGEYKKSDYDGKMEFIFKSAIISIPADPRAMLKYAVETTAGLGEATGEKIWASYGAAWREHPDLDGISGIREATRFAWQDTLKRLERQTGEAQTMAFLLGHGLTMNMATAAFNEWGEGAITKVRDNPYCISELPHYGFCHADNLREKFGIGDLDPRRLDAAVLYSIGRVMERGDTALLLEQLRADFDQLISSDTDVFSPAIERLVEAKKIVTMKTDKSVRISTIKIFEDEKAVFERFCA